MVRIVRTVRASWSPVVIAVVCLTVLGLAMAGTLAGVLAQGGPPPPDAEPGAVGFQGGILGAIDPAVAPGYRLVMAESVFAPGAYVTRHVHPTAIVVCVQSGALGFAIQNGVATITRGGDGATPAATESLAVGDEVVLEPRDCVSFDEFTAHTTHTGWNASDEPTVLWESRLLKGDEPFTTFVDAQGTPVP
ncbi:MAG: cupin domain-containing protein [Chloroflexota bacterium]|nr:cupin domain-containing protein [Chloroflexota bacterium]